MKLRFRVIHCTGIVFTYVGGGLQNYKLIVYCSCFATCWR